MDTLINIQDVSFGYESELVLEHINLAVNRGDFIALIGSNGAGKSTLLRLILGELSPVRGSIRLLGTDVSRFSAWPKIGYVSQNSIQGNAGFPATAFEVVLANLYSEIGMFHFPKKEHREKAERALQKVGMEKQKNRMIGSLSGGQQQRVMLARVLVNRPELMILDEPTTGVDEKNASALYELLLKLNREGLTIVMVTHDVARASQYVSRTACLEEGTLVELDRHQLKDELSHRHKHPSLEEENGHISV